jgi:hypothetical protein
VLDALAEFIQTQFEVFFQALAGCSPDRGRRPQPSIALEM